jgi:hypothetical protein
MFADELRNIVKSWLDQHKPSATWKEKGEVFGLSTPVLFNFLNDPKKTISIETAEKILAVIGGDMRRAMPGYDPVAEAMRIAEKELKVVRVSGPMFSAKPNTASLLARYLELQEWERDQAEELRRKAEKSAALEAELEGLLRRHKEGR